MSWLSSFMVWGPLLVLLTSAPQPPGTRFVAIGHFRDLITDFPDILMEVAEAINAEDPDYVFLLGDFIGEGIPEEWETFDTFLAAIEAPVFSAPGNHEFNTPEEYRARFGYLYNTLITDDANFVFINSSDDLPLIKNYLDHKWDELDNGKPTILLSHFILWTAIADTGKVWDKSFGPEEILPYLSGRVDHIISGDNPGAVGGSYAADTLDAIVMHPVGIGFAGNPNPVLFFVGDVEPSGALTLTPHTMELAADDRWYTVDRSELNYRKTFLAKRQQPAVELTLLDRVSRRLKHPVAQQTAALVSVFWIAVGWILYRRMRRRMR